MRGWRQLSGRLATVLLSLLVVVSRRIRTLASSRQLPVVNRNFFMELCCCAQAVVQSYKCSVKLIETNSDILKYMGRLYHAFSVLFSRACYLSQNTGTVPTSRSYPVGVWVGAVLANHEYFKKSLEARCLNFVNLCSAHYAPSLPVLCCLHVEYLYRRKFI